MTIWIAAAIVLSGYCSFGLLLACFADKDDTPKDIKALRRINTDTAKGRKKYLARIKEIAADRLAQTKDEEDVIYEMDPTSPQSLRR